MTPVAPAPRVVTAFEGRLLRILRCFVRHVPLDQALPLVLERVPRPPALSPACVELVGDSLAKGCMLFLVRAGGWRRERFLRAGRPRDGRLWERSNPAELGLTFSRHALEFLIWITAHRPNDAKPPLEEVLPAAELTPADRLLLFLAYDVLHDTEAGPALRPRPAFATSGLIRLAFPDDFRGVSEPAPDFAPWTTGPGAVMLEALQPWLEARWVQVERRKGHTGDWSELRELGLSQERVLVAFTDAAEAADRPDLVRFLLRVAAAVLPDGVTPTAFFGGLQGPGPARLADRIEVHRRALALPRHLSRLAQWQKRARGIGYLDEGYAASQLWKADWERLNGDALAARAAALARQVEPLTVQ
jgi:hypothetical protein